MIFRLSHVIECASQHDASHEAFRFLSASITYGQLSVRSNQLAHALRESGVRRGDRVGIYLNKCLEAPVAVFGIMKSGAAYVPLDPGAPIARLAKVIDDCQIRCLVSHDAKAKSLESLLAATRTVTHVLGTDVGRAASQPWSALESFSTRPVRHYEGTDQDLAYIIYTSGSSGAPKGIMHTHASGLSYARMAAHLYGVGPSDRLSNHSPLHFDMSTFDYFSGPLQHASTVIVSEAHARLPASLSQLIQDERITIWYSVPFALTQLLLHGVLDNRDLTQLRWVLFGGEPFPPKHLHALRAKLPNARFSNVYGPAEVNQCTYYHVPDDQPADHAPIPIGRTCPNTEGLVVDSDNRTVDAGSVGELLVRSPTMMRGYWARPDLNAMAFYRRPVTDDLDDIFYRTGDLVHVKHDGTFAFLGRKDRQIKIRGHRVELDDVESSLANHPDVEEAAAYDLPADDDSRTIEAAVVLRAGRTASPATLRQHASRELPTYAVPERVKQFEHFPRTTSGKIDRRTLREMAIAENTTEEP